MPPHTHSDLEIITSDQTLFHTVRNECGAQYSNGICDTFPAIPYLNNNFTDCQVLQIRIRMGRADTCSDGLSCQWLTWSKTKATASTTCNIDKGSPPYNIKVTITYDSFPNEFDASVELDSWHQASIWSGAMLLSMWLQGLRTQMVHM